jgi:large subunit ribosomal protein L10
MNDFRSKMRAAGGTVRVAKNRLAKIALQGTESEGMTDLFKGQTLIAFSEDPVTAPKVVMDFAKTNDKLVVLGGAMGATTLNAEGVKSLATLPSLDELRAKLLGLINARQPASRRLSQHRQASLPACSRPMPRRTKPPEAEFRCCI